MDRKWPLRTDILVCWKTYIFFVLYLLFISINRSFASTTVGWSNGEPRALNSCYIYLQFISCLFIVSITANIFEETFRTESRQYIQTFPLGTLRIIFFLFFRVIFFILLPYIPSVLMMFTHANESIEEYLSLFPNIGHFPLINPLFPLIHCIISVNFYVIATIFLLFVLKRKVIVLILILSYCALEATMLHFMFPKYVVFRGAFNTPDFYHMFPSNIIILFFVSLAMLIYTLSLYSRNIKSGVS